MNETVNEESKKEYELKNNELINHMFRKGEGGSYSILNAAIAKCILNEDIMVDIVPDEVQSITGLCYKSISNSLNSLAKWGFLSKVNYREPGTGRNLVKYNINPVLVEKYLKVHVFVNKDEDVKDDEKEVGEIGSE